MLYQVLFVGVFPVALIGQLRHEHDNDLATGQQAHLALADVSILLDMFVQKSLQVVLDSEQDGAVAFSLYAEDHEVTIVSACYEHVGPSRLRLRRYHCATLLDDHHGILANLLVVQRLQCRQAAEYHLITEGVKAVFLACFQGRCLGARLDLNH